MKIDGRYATKTPYEMSRGWVFNADMVRSNDTYLAVMGNADGVAHFNEFSFKSLCKQAFV